MPVSVVAILDPTDVEVAFQFLVINNKATKVPPDHIKLLQVNFPDDELQSRLKTARMSVKHASLVVIVDSSDDSPFYHSVSWPVETGDEPAESDRRELVKPTAIEAALNYVASKDLPGLTEGDDARLTFFFAIWDAIHLQWPQLWVESSRLLSKVGMISMTQFIVDDLTPLVDRERLDAANYDHVLNEVTDVIKVMDPEFWTADWKLASLDTSAGRQIVYDAIQKLRRNGQRGLPWYDEIGLLVQGSEHQG
jgi:hypothetical protein